MLIEFSVENFRSIKNEARLSLVAGPGKEHRDSNVMIPELNQRVRATPLVRSAAIYGRKRGREVEPDPCAIYHAADCA